MYPLEVVQTRLAVSSPGTYKGMPRLLELHLQRISLLSGAAVWLQHAKAGARGLPGPRCNAAIRKVPGLGPSPACAPGGGGWHRSVTA